MSGLVEGTPEAIARHHGIGGSPTDAPADGPTRYTLAEVEAMLRASGNHLSANTVAVLRAAGGVPPVMPYGLPGGIPVEHPDESECAAPADGPTKEASPWWSEWTTDGRYCVVQEVDKIMVMLGAGVRWDDTEFDKVKQALGGAAPASPAVLPFMGFRPTPGTSPTPWPGASPNKANSDEGAASPAVRPDEPEWRSDLFRDYDVVCYAIADESPEVRLALIRLYEIAKGSGGPAVREAAERLLAAVDRLDTQPGVLIRGREATAQCVAVHEAAEALRAALAPAEQGEK